MTEAERALLRAIAEILISRERQAYEEFASSGVGNTPDGEKLERLLNSMVQEGPSRDVPAGSEQARKTA